MNILVRLTLIFVGVIAWFPQVQAQECHPCTATVVIQPSFRLTQTSPYSCDISSDTKAMCLDCNFQPGYGYIEIYHQIVDEGLGTIAIDHQMNFGSEVSSYAFAQGFLNHTYYSVGHYYFADPETGATLRDDSAQGGPGSCGY